MPFSTNLSVVALPPSAIKRFFLKFAAGTDDGVVPILLVACAHHHAEEILFPHYSAIFARAAAPYRHGTAETIGR